MADEPLAEGVEQNLQEPEAAECLRCRQLKPVDDDGFCAACARAMEQACL